jgi:energy-coupling factor transport system permease protein
MVATYREIVDAQAMRGYEPRGPRDYLNLAPLLLSGGIERAVTMSELLESRGFGGAPAPARSRLGALAPAIGLGAFCIGVYLFAVGEPLAALLAAMIGSALLALTVRMGRTLGVRRTRYRPLVWRPRDWVVLAGAAIATVSVLLVDADAIRYEPYPTLTWPVASVPLAVGLLGLLSPAFVLLWQERKQV